MWILIFIVVGALVGWGHGQLPVSTCQNLDTKACILYHKAKPDLCNDPTFANGPCKRFCGNCPLECYSCLTPVYFPDDCNTTKACRADETCVLKHLRAPDGHNEYVMSCENKQVCQSLGFLRGSLVGKRNAHAQDRQERGLSINCCDVDFCNYPSRSAQTTTISTTPSTTLTTLPTTVSTTTTKRTTTTTKRTTTTERTTTTTSTTTTPATTTRLTTPSKTTSTVKTTTPTTIPTTSSSDIDCKKDIVFVLDDSGSVGPRRFNLSLDFAASVVSQLHVGPDAAQIAMLVFSNRARLQWGLDKFHTKADVLNAITTVNHLGGITRTHDALRAVRTEILMRSNGDRFQVDNVVILMSDGQSTFKDETLKEARNLHSSYTHVITLLLGQDVDMDEITAIATNQEHIFNVMHYAKLQSFLPGVTKLACRS